MRKKKAHIPLKTKLASALCHMLRPDENGNLVPIIDRDSAKAMTADQVLSIFHFDHDPIPEALDGPTIHWNLTPRPILEHRTKTAKIDRPVQAKVDRITPAHEEHRRRMLAKAGQEVPEAEPERQRPRARLKSRPFPPGHPKLRTRPFPKRQKGDAR